ncbi:MAG: helix-turn-helix transcriptional regulator [Gammaproteobacteria bacterium]|nr:helix-turn-helix transcriptional regulator [Gammaproteobacteria bacterium]
MIRCNLSRILGEKKLKIADIANGTSLHRNTLTALYRETAQRIELSAVDELCEFLNCSVGELFERVEEDNK